MFLQLFSFILLFFIHFSKFRKFVVFLNLLFLSFLNFGKPFFLFFSLFCWCSALLIHKKMNCFGQKSHSDNMIQQQNWLINERSFPNTSKTRMELFLPLSVQDRSTIMKTVRGKQFITGSLRTQPVLKIQQTATKPIIRNRQQVPLQQFYPEVKQ